MSVNCVYCGQVNASDAAVCLGCGRTLPPKVETTTETPSWGAPQSPYANRPPDEPPAPGGGWSQPSNPYQTYDANGGWQQAGSSSFPPQPQPPSWGQAPPPPAWGEWPQQPPPWNAQGPAYGQPPSAWQPSFGGYGAPLPFEVADAKSKAKAAMICGIVGLVCFNVVLGPIALVLGIKAKSMLQQYNVQDGQGMAIAGIVLGTIDSLLGVLYILAMIVS